MLSETRFHAAAASLLNELRIPLKDTTRSVRSLSGGQRQLVAVARAMGRQPRLLVLDEPTAALGVQESAQVEELIMRLREQGTTILLACHDIDQMFRLADRIVVLRQGRVVADLRPADTHPDDVVALLSGQQVDSSARRQLTRLHGLADRLVSRRPVVQPVADPVRARRGARHRAAVHPPGHRQVRWSARRRSASRPASWPPWARLPFGPGGGPVGLAAADERPVIADNVRAGAAWRSFRDLAKTVNVASSWSVPVLGPGGLSGVITVFRTQHRRAAAGRARPGHRLRRVRGQRDRAGPAAGPGDRAQPGAGDDQGDAGDAGRPGPGRRGTVHRGPVAAPRAAGRRGRAAHPARGAAGRLARLAGPDGTDAGRPRARCGRWPRTRCQRASGRRGPAAAQQPRHRARAVAFAAPGGPTVLLASWRRAPPTRRRPR